MFRAYYLMVNTMSFTNRKMKVKNTNSQVNKLKNEYFKNIKEDPKDFLATEFKTDRFKN